MGFYKIGCIKKLCEGLCSQNMVCKLMFNKTGTFRGTVVELIMKLLKLSSPDLPEQSNRDTDPKNQDRCRTHYSSVRYPLG